MKMKWILAFALALAVNGFTGGATIAQTQHDNGLGQSYADSGPLGVPGNAATFTANMANSAAMAWPSIGTIISGQCAGPGAAGMVAKQTPTSCAVWVYSSNRAGHVHLNTANNSCICPTTSDLVWK